jgi:hypothetical protein
MNCISDLFSTDTTIQNIIDDRTEEIEDWLRKLEKCRAKHFGKLLFDAIKEFTEKSYYHDFSGIHEYDFFNQLKPRVRHKLISGLFHPFISNFFYMFNDNEFEAG